MQNQSKNIDTLSEAAKLKDLLTKLQPMASKYSAVIFHASKLMIYNRQQHHLNKMMEDINQIFSSNNGKAFLLLNNDLLCIVEKTTQLTVERQISQFKRTIPSDPLLIVDAHKRELFVTTFDLGSTWRDFCVQISEIQDNPLYSARLSSSDSSNTGALITTGIDIETLNLIESVLKQSDMSNFIRRQYVFWFDGINTYKQLSQHFYISLMELQKSLNVSESLTGNAWLFKQITFYLDRQMLKNLPNLLNQKVKYSSSINLNLRTLVTPYFHAFISKAIDSSNLTIYFDLVDVIAHPDVLLYAEELLRPHKIRIGINNIQSNHFKYINMPHFPIDVFKMDACLNLSKLKEPIKEIIGQRGDNSVILHRCDSEEQVKAGYSLGIRIFEGKYLDIVNKPKISVNS